jgi:hypothetical protein
MYATQKRENDEWKKYERFVTVACANFQTKRGDKGANLEKREKITEKAVQGTIT